MSSKFLLSRVEETAQKETCKLKKRASFVQNSFGLFSPPVISLVLFGMFILIAAKPNLLFIKITDYICRERQHYVLFPTYA